jgi:uncharacterized protein (TIGR00369 family)
VSNNESNASISPKEQSLEKEKLIELMLAGFNTTPYHQHIGLSMRMEEGQLVAHFSKNEHLLGNVSRNMVHGGLISSVFDALGGVLCSVSLIDKYKDLDRKQGIRKLNRLCTLGLNTNYHAPAKADEYFARGKLSYQGNSIMHAEMQMVDNKDTLIASASASYMY